jgi:hypothetical protein
MATSKRFEMITARSTMSVSMMSSTTTTSERTPVFCVCAVAFALVSGLRGDVPSG